MNNLVVILGLSGSGKSTLANSIVKDLDDSEVICTDTWLRDICKEKFNKKAKDLNKEERRYISNCVIDLSKNYNCLVVEGLGVRMLDVDVLYDNNTEIIILDYDVYECTSRSYRRQFLDKERMVITGYKYRSYKEWLDDNKEYNIHILNFKEEVKRKTSN